MEGATTKMEGDIASCFHVSVVGQIESAYFPLGSDGSQTFCHYELVAGPDWELISGLKSGITQRSAMNSSRDVVFNMPLEFTYKATNPFGWPQIVLSLYGKNFWGTETVLGYARAHIPVFKSEPKSINVPVISPRCSNMLAEFVSWITGRNPELRDPKVLCQGTKNKGLQTEAYGKVKIKLSTITRGTTNLGYEWGQMYNK